MVDRRIERDVDDFLSDGDGAAPDREVVDHAAVIGGVDDGRGFGRESGQILRYRDTAEVVIAQEGLERDRRRDLAGAHQRRRDLEDPSMDFLAEVIRNEEVRHTVEGVVVDQDGAEQRLLGLYVMRRLAERLGGSGRLRGCRPALHHFDIGHARFACEIVFGRAVPASLDRAGEVNAMRLVWTAA